LSDKQIRANDKQLIELCCDQGFIVTMTTMDIGGYTDIIQNITVIPTTSPGDDIAPIWGFISAGIAILFFGTNFVPVKKFDTGDGRLNTLFSE